VVQVVEARGVQRQLVRREQELQVKEIVVGKVGQFLRVTITEVAGGVLGQLDYLLPQMSQVMAALVLLLHSVELLQLMLAVVEAEAKVLLVLVV
jgi:hypothetical protein